MTEDTQKNLLPQIEGIDFLFVFPGPGPGTLGKSQVTEPNPIPELRRWERGYWGLKVGPWDTRIFWNF